MIRNEMDPESIKIDPMEEMRQTVENAASAMQSELDSGSGNSWNAVANSTIGKLMLVVHMAKAKGQLSEAQFQRYNERLDELTALNNEVRAKYPTEKTVPQEIQGAFFDKINNFLDK